MSRLQVYISHHPHDSDFTQRLSWALRDAGAIVWFATRNPYFSRLSKMTVDEMTCDACLVVVSNAALASEKVWATLNRALTQRNESRRQTQATLELLTERNSAYAAVYAENRQYFERHVIPVLADLPLPGQLTDDWRDLLNLFPDLVLPDSPLSPNESISEAVRAVAATIPPFAVRLDLAAIEIEESARLPEWLRPVSPLVNMLTHWPAPLEVGGNIDELIRRGEEWLADVPAPLDTEEPETLSAWCVVANVAEEQHYGPGGSEIRRGTKHFAPGAKVYCLPAQWGDGYEDIIVIGRHRKSHRYIKIVIPSRRLTNWRADLVYSPHVIAEIDDWWDGTPRSRQRAEQIAMGCREREAEQRRAANPPPP